MIEVATNKGGPTPMQRHQLATAFMQFKQARMQKTMTMHYSISSNIAKLHFRILKKKDFSFKLWNFR